MEQLGSQSFLLLWPRPDLATNIAVCVCLLCFCSDFPDRDASFSHLVVVSLVEEEDRAFRVSVCGLHPVGHL